MHTILRPLRSALLCSFSIGLVVGASSAVAEPISENEWDTRLNGIWKVTSSTQDGELLKDDTDCKYAICDGVIVSASPSLNHRFMGRIEPDPSWKPGQLPFGVLKVDDSPSKDKEAAPDRVEAADPLEGIIVRLEVDRATVKKETPYPWIDLKTAFEEDYNWPGIYHIEGDILTLSFGVTRPTTLVSPKVNYDGYTRPIPVTRVVTLVRKPQRSSHVAEEGSP